MPIYEYVCDHCERAFERYVRSWNEPVVCPSCQGKSLSRQLSTFAVSGGAAGGPRSAGGGCCGGGSCGCAH